MLIMNVNLCLFGISFLLFINLSQKVEGLHLTTKNNSISPLTRTNSFVSWWNLFNRRTTIPPFTFSKTCPECKCGAPNINRRIVGGLETNVNQYPWVGMLLHSNRFYCGISLINDRYAITAAHCVSGFRRESITLRFLQHDRRIQNKELIERMVTKVIQHPNYVSRTFNNDIALLQLSNPIKYNDMIHPVCLPTEGETFAGRHGLVTGWGALSETGQMSNTLQEVLVPIISNVECNRTFSGEITQNMLCAGHRLGMQDACQGDSGGPLHVIQNREYQLAGIVSWGDGCARPNLPGVYTRVNRYLHWIKSSTSDACYC